MCWSLKDVLYFELKKQKYPGSDYFDSEEIKQKHKEEVKLDYTLYSYFLKSFNRKILMEPKIDDEVYIFKQIKIKVNNFCDQILCNVISVDTLFKMREYISASVKIESSYFMKNLM